MSSSCNQWSTQAGNTLPLLLFLCHIMMFIDVDDTVRSSRRGRARGSLLACYMHSIDSTCIWSNGFAPYHSSPTLHTHVDSLTPHLKHRQSLAVICSSFHKYTSTLHSRINFTLHSDTLHLATLQFLFTDCAQEEKLLTQLYREILYRTDLYYNVIILTTRGQQYRQHVLWSLSVG